MALRKILFATCIVVAATVFGSPLRASDSSRVDMRIWGEYGYSYAISNYADAAATAVWHAAPNIEIGGGLRLKIRGIYGFDAHTRFAFPLLYGRLFVENRYLWQLYDASNMQEINSALMLGYSLGSRLELKVGCFNKFYTTIRRPDRNADYIFEPLNLAYSLNYWFWPSQHHFNAGLQICNVDDFFMERFYSPQTSLLFSYRFSTKFSLYSAARLHNTGIFDLSADRFDISFLIGTQLSW